MDPMGLFPERNVIPLRRRARHARHTRWGPAVARLEARVAELERHMAAFDERIAVLGRHARMQVAAALSVLLHALVILGVSFKVPEPPRLAVEPLEVTLVNTKTTARPLKADALAQANLDGGGNTDAAAAHEKPAAGAARCDAVDRSRPRPSARRAARARRAAAHDPQASKIDGRGAPGRSRSLQTDPHDRRRRRRTHEPQPGDRAPGSPDRQESGGLPAAAAPQVRRRPDQEFRFARYIEDWRAKVERVGEMNYPQAARDQKVYGSLVVTVSIKSDGALDNVEINRSSGIRMLDEAAIRIVKLAAPYAPFPADIAKDTDILSITRTWMFTRSDQFVTE